MKNYCMSMWSVVTVTSLRNYTAEEAIQIASNDSIESAIEVRYLINRGYSPTEALLERDLI